MNSKTDKLLAWISSSDLDELDKAERRLRTAQGIARRKRVPCAKLERIAGVRHAILNARIARVCRLEGAIHQARGHEACIEPCATDAYLTPTEAA